MLFSLAFVTAFAGCSRTTNSHWVEVGRTPDAVLYSEPKIQRPNNKFNLVSMRSLDDYTSEQRLTSGLAYRSLAYTGLYDCATGTWHITRAEFFAQPMGNGKPVYVQSFSLEEAMKAMGKYAGGSPAQLRFVDACERGLNK